MLLRASMLELAKGEKLDANSMQFDTNYDILLLQKVLICRLFRNNVFYTACPRSKLAKVKGYILKTKLF